MTATERKRKRSPHQPVGRWIRREKRLAIYLRDEFKCLVCWLDLHDAEPSGITLDHVLPRSQGGGNREGNLYTCCRSCNSQRAHKSLSDWLLEKFNEAGAKECRADIRRQTRKSIKRHFALARSIFQGKDSRPSH